jgi:hypothetical protein
MQNPATVFALEVGHWDYTGTPETLATPHLSLYFSSACAAERREGLNIVEGDLWFFDSNGAPLEARFSKEPYIDQVRNRYFKGEYTLVPGRGISLPDSLLKWLTDPRARIRVWQPADDESAKFFGWPDVDALRQCTAQALDILPSDLRVRVAFERWESPVPLRGRPCP